jgi:hypothetical protein
MDWISKMNVQPHFRFSLATLALLVYLMLANVANGLYTGLLIQPSPVFQLASAMAFIWALGWWIIDDNKRYGLTWVQSYGVFLYVIGWMIIPIYLFRTRGSKAFLPLLLFAGIYLATYVFGIIIAVVINVLRNL